MVEERGGVIGLLQREVEDLKAALAGVETHPGVSIDPGTPAIDPRLEQELEKVGIIGITLLSNCKCLAQRWMPLALRARKGPLQRRRTRGGKSTAFFFLVCFFI